MKIFIIHQKRKIFAFSLDNELENFWFFQDIDRQFQSENFSFFLFLNFVSLLLIHTILREVQNVKYLVKYSKNKPFLLLSFRIPIPLPFQKNFVSRKYPYPCIGISEILSKLILFFNFPFNGIGTFENMPRRLDD